MHLVCGYYIAIKMPNKTAEEMTKAIIAALSEFPDEAVKTITCDGRNIKRKKNLKYMFIIIPLTLILKSHM